MHRTALVLALLLLPALADAGLDLSWNDCVFGDGANGPATSDISLNCSQPGNDVTKRDLFIQFMVPEQFDRAAAWTAWLLLVDEKAYGRPLGAFWHAERVCTGQTRRGVSPYDVIPESCINGDYLDVSGGGADGFESMVWIPDSPSQGRARVILTVARGEGLLLVPGTRYYLMHLGFTNRNRQADCENPNSCSDAMQVFFYKLLVESLDRPGHEITGPADGMSQCAGIHGASTPACSASPVESSTWGRLKSLYR